MQTQLKVKLSFFNFLQYFIWGSWYVSMGAYLANTLKFGGQEIGAAYGAFAIGSMISPFFIGLLADRYFPSEKMLAVLALLGGATLCLLPRFDTFLPFYSTLILYCALYTPTLALGNSLALSHLEDAKTAFPRVKLWSAVGCHLDTFEGRTIHNSILPRRGSFHRVGDLFANAATHTSTENR